MNSLHLRKHRLKSSELLPQAPFNDPSQVKLLYLTTSPSFLIKNKVATVSSADVLKAKRGDKKKLRLNASKDLWGLMNSRPQTCCDL